MKKVLLLLAADPDTARLASALRAASFEVTLAASPCDARAAMDRAEFAVVVVDLLLRDERGKSALELAREMRVRAPGTRVILTSSYHLSERQLARADCGVSGFIPKPFDMEEVIDFLRCKAASAEVPAYSP